MDSPAVTLDLDRRRRCGFPEVVYGPGKSTDQLRDIVSTLLRHEEPVLVTRIDAIQAASLLAAFPDGRHNELARTFRVDAKRASQQSELPQSPCPNTRGTVAVISAGTGDLPVAEEARETLEWMGVHVTMIHDVGVAGLRRPRQAGLSR